MTTRSRYAKALSDVTEPPAFADLKDRGATYAMKMKKRRAKLKSIEAELDVEQQWREQGYTLRRKKNYIGE